MEARCEKFMVDAKRPADAKTPKDIAKLRSFLFKNQNHRFTNGEQEHLFRAVSLYATAAAGAGGAAAAASAASGGGGGDPEDDPALGLIEDALKMPFTVFTTSHKKAFLRWMDKLQQQAAAAAGGGAGGGGGGGGAAPKPRHQLIDLADEIAEVMDPEDGETLAVPLASCPPEVLEELRRGFEEGLDVRVAVRRGGGGEPAICGVECRE